MHEFAAITFLLLIALAVIAWAISGFLRSPYTLAQTMLWLPGLLLVAQWRAKLPRQLPLAVNQGQ